MADINVHSNVDVNIKLSQEEIETLKKAYEILKEVSRELWRSDAGETETYTDASSAMDDIYYFMKCDCGVNVDEKRYW